MLSILSMLKTRLILTGLLFSTVWCISTQPIDQYDGPLLHECSSAQDPFACFCPAFATSYDLSGRICSSQDLAQLPAAPTFLFSFNSDQSNEGNADIESFIYLILEAKKAGILGNVSLVLRDRGLLDVNVHGVSTSSFDQYVTAASLNVQQPPYPNFTTAQRMIVHAASLSAMDSALQRQEITRDSIDVCNTNVPLATLTFNVRRSLVEAERLVFSAFDVPGVVYTGSPVFCSSALNYVPLLAVTGDVDIHAKMRLFTSVVIEKLRISRLAVIALANGDEDVPIESFVDGIESAARDHRFKLEVFNVVQNSADAGRRRRRRRRGRSLKQTDAATFDYASVVRSIIAADYRFIALLVGDPENSAIVMAEFIQQGADLSKYAFLQPTSGEFFELVERQLETYAEELGSVESAYAAPPPVEWGLNPSYNVTMSDLRRALHGSFMVAPSSDPGTGADAGVSIQFAASLARANATEYPFAGGHPNLVDDYSSLAHLQVCALAHVFAQGAQCGLYGPLRDGALLNDLLQASQMNGSSGRIRFAAGENYPETRFDLFNLRLSATDRASGLNAVSVYRLADGSVAPIEGSLVVWANNESFDPVAAKGYILPSKASHSRRMSPVEIIILALLLFAGVVLSGYLLALARLRARRLMLDRSLVHILPTEPLMVSRDGATFFLKGTYMDQRVVYELQDARHAVAHRPVGLNFEEDNYKRISELLCILGIEYNCEFAFVEDGLAGTAQASDKANIRSSLNDAFQAAVAATNSGTPMRTHKKGSVELRTRPRMLAIGSIRASAGADELIIPEAMQMRRSGTPCTSAVTGGVAPFPQHLRFTRIGDRTHRGSLGAVEGAMTPASPGTALAKRELSPPPLQPKRGRRSLELAKALRVAKDLAPIVVMDSCSDGARHISHVQPAKFKSAATGSSYVVAPSSTVKSAPRPTIRVPPASAQSFGRPLSRFNTQRLSNDTGASADDVRPAQGVTFFTPHKGLQEKSLSLSSIQVQDAPDATGGPKPDAQTRSVTQRVMSTISGSFAARVVQWVLHKILPLGPLGFGRLSREVSTLQAVKHPRLLGAIGALWSTSGEIVLIAHDSALSGTTLEDLLVGPMPLDLDERAQIIVDLLSALAYSSMDRSNSSKLVRGSISTTNVFMDEDFSAKLGLSIGPRLGLMASSASIFYDSGMGGKNRWQCTKSEAADVYAFGAVAKLVLIRRGAEGYRSSAEISALPWPADVVQRIQPEILEAIAHCLIDDPKDRPTFAGLQRRLAPLSRSLFSIGRKDSPLTSYTAVDRREMRRSRSIFKRERADSLLLGQHSELLGAGKDAAEPDKWISKDPLRRFFPRKILSDLKEGRKPEPVPYTNVSVYFADVVGFTTICQTIAPSEVSELLDRLFTEMDAACLRNGLVKIETIGDCFMACGNVTLDDHGDEDDDPEHVARMARFARETLDIASQTLIDLKDPARGPISMRVGFHVGDCVGVVTGGLTPHFTLLGDCVNMAARMESTGVPNRVQISLAAADALVCYDQTYLERLEYRGCIEVKGKGLHDTFFLVDADQNAERRLKTSFESLALLNKSFHDGSDNSKLAAVRETILRQSNLEESDNGHSDSAGAPPG